MVLTDLIFLIYLRFVELIVLFAHNFDGLRFQKIGTKNAVFIAICGYVLATFLAYFMTDRIHFFLLGAMIGLFQGGIQALSRSLYARLVPIGKEAEFFGFYNMLGKFAAVVGPVLMGWVTLVTGNVRFGILSILILFVAGAFVLGKVDFEEGEKLALGYGGK